MVLYVQQDEKVCQCKNTTQCLDKLAGTPGEKSRPDSFSTSGIEAAVNSGQSLKKIWEALASEGLQMSYHSFHKAVWRAEGGKPTAASNWGKQDKLLRRKHCRKQKWKQLKAGPVCESKTT